MQHHKAQLVFSQGVSHKMESLDKGAEHNHFLGALGPLLCILIGTALMMKDNLTNVKGRCCRAKGSCAQLCYVTGHLRSTMNGILALQGAFLAQ